MNASPETDVTVSGSATVSRLAQPSNALAPIVSTDVALRSTAVRFSQPLNAPASTVVSVSGSATVSRLAQPSNALAPIVSTDVALRSTAVRFSQPLNAPVSIAVSVCGSSTASRLAQPLNAPPEMRVTPVLTTIFWMLPVSCAHGRSPSKSHMSPSPVIVSTPVSGSNAKVSPSPHGPDSGASTA